jgi:O-antigen/teichoic acid export membrane protein
MNFRRLFAQAFITSGFYVISSQVVGFFGLWLSLKYLSQKDVGTFASIAAFSNFLLMFSYNGISQIVHREDYDKKLLTELSLISLLLGGLFTLIMMALAWPIDWFYAQNGSTEKNSLVAPAMVLSLVFLAQSFWSVPRAQMQKNDRYGLVGRMVFLGQVVNSGVQIGFAYLGFGHWAMIFCQIASNAFLSLWSMSITGIWPTFWGFKSLTEHIEKVKRFTLNISSITLIQYGARNLDNILIGRQFGKGALGVYEVAYKFLFFPLLAVAGVASQVIYPMFSKIKNDFKQFETEFFFLQSVLSFLGWIAGMAVVFLAPLAVKSFFKPEWQAIIEYLPYFGLTLYGQTLASPISAFYILLKKEKHLLFITTIQGLTILLAFGLALLFGPIYFAKFMLLQVACFGLPFVMIWANYRYLGFDLKRLLFFWIPKILVLTSLYILWESQLYDFFNALCIAYTIWLLYREIKKINRFLVLLKSEQKQTQD